jgi:hypothetical protein
LQRVVTVLLPRFDQRQTVFDRIADPLFDPVDFLGHRQHFAFVRSGDDDDPIGIVRPARRMA